MDPWLYKALLLAKRDELGAAGGQAESPLPAANDKSGDLVDWARADTEAEVQIQRRQADAHLEKAIKDALARINRGSFGVCEVCKAADFKSESPSRPMDARLSRLQGRVGSQPWRGG